MWDIKWNLGSISHRKECLFHTEWDVLTCQSKNHKLLASVDPLANHYLRQSMVTHSYVIGRFLLKIQPQLWEIFYLDIPSVVSINPTKLSLICNLSYYSWKGTWSGQSKLEFIRIVNPGVKTFQPYKLFMWENPFTITSYVRNNFTTTIHKDACISS